MSDVVILPTTRTTSATSSPASPASSPTGAPASAHPGLEVDDVVDLLAELRLLRDLDRPS